MSLITEKSKDNEKIVHFNDYVNTEKYITAVFLPYSLDVTTGDFLIEDYFSQVLLEDIIKRVSKLSHPVTKLPKLGEKIKKELQNNYHNYSKTDFEGFKPLLDKLSELLGTE